MNKKKLASLFPSGGIFLTVAILLPFGLATAQTPNDTIWTQLWNGNNLADWDIKFQGSALNVNLNNTFRSVSGNLEVNYTGWATAFNGAQFGHAAYKIKPFSFYFLRSEYQTWGTQVAGGPGWAIENNGFMLHSQSMASMGLNQDFPVSMETQLLGPANNSAGGTGTAGTMNLCTPGTQWYSTPTGTTSLVVTHCTAATANVRAPSNTGWNYVSALVLGDSIVRHYVGNASNFMAQTVFTYYRPNLDNGTRLTQGYITIQAETAPYRFRRIEVANLVGCMTVGNPNYKTYFLRNDPVACNVVNVGQGYAVDPGFIVSPLVASFVPVKQNRKLEVFDTQGRMLFNFIIASGSGEVRMPKLQSGTYYAKLTAKEGSMTQRLVVF